MFKGSSALFGPFQAGNTPLLSRGSQRAQGDAVFFKQPNQPDQPTNRPIPLSPTVSAFQP